MTYTINKAEALKTVEETISRVASEAVGADGGSLYDMLRIKSRDSGALDAHYEDAVSGLCVELADIAEVTDNGIEFNVPDFDTSLENAVKSSLDRYVSCIICALWLEEKGVEANAVYGARATAALKKAHTLLKSRKAPKR